MKRTFGSRSHYCLARASVFLLSVALIIGMASCGPVTQYSLTISAMEGGDVITPGEGTFSYSKPTVVTLIADAYQGYRFIAWTGDVDAIDNANAATTNIIVNASYSIRAEFAPEMSGNLEIRTWYDLDAIRYNVANNHTLMNDLDSTTPGYDALAGPAAHGGKGWEPIGSSDTGAFNGVFDGQGHQIRELFINRRDESEIGLFGAVEQSGIIQNIGVTDVTVIGAVHVGSLVGYNSGVIVRNSWSSGSVSGSEFVGGLVGANDGSAMSNSHSACNTSGLSYTGGLVGANRESIVGDSYSTGTVIGGSFTGGLVGENGYHGFSTLSDCYSTGTVIGGDFTGGLVGANRAYGSNVRNCYADCNVRGGKWVGGLMGDNEAIVSDSHSIGKVEGHNYAGGLVGSNLGTVSKSYSTGKVEGYKYAGGLVGSNLGTVNKSYSTSYISCSWWAGGLVGENLGTVSDSYSTGFVSYDSYVGGLVGQNEGIVSNSYSTAYVTGYFIVGGLVGENEGALNNSYSAGSVSGNTHVGGLVGQSGNASTVGSCFWDIAASGQAASDGGTGKTTAEMRDVVTFTDVGAEGLDEPWDMIAVADSWERNPSYIWNIAGGTTYPFLSWQ
jgi:hypothetical protein